MNGLIDG